MLAKIETAFSHLLQFPNTGATRESLGVGLRVTFVGKYAVYYSMSVDEVIIVRVLHGARDISAIVDTGGFAL